MVYIYVYIYNYMILYVYIYNYIYIDREILVEFFLKYIHLYKRMLLASFFCFNCQDFSQDVRR